MKSKILNCIHHLLTLRYLIKYQYEIDKLFILDIKKLKFFLKGYTSDKLEIYNLKENKYYLNDYQRRLSAKINGRYSIILNDKLIFEKTINNRTVCAKNLGYIKNEEIISNGKKTNFEDIFKLGYDKLILKPRNNSGGGKNVFKLEIHDEKIKKNNSFIKKESLKVEDFEDFIICEYIENGSYIKEVFNETTNTIRILTMINPKDQTPFIATAVQRIGSSSTFPVDNVHSGGYTSKIDLETGKLGKSFYHTNKNRNIKTEELHKDSKVKIEGIEIKNWKRIKISILELASEFNFAPYIGWDVVATDDGLRIIEANSVSEVNFLQIHEPLLVKKDVEMFYKYHGII